MTEALDKSPFDRAWANLGNVATVSCFTTPCYESEAEWQAWRQQQLTYFGQQYPINAALDVRAQFGNLPLYAGYWWDARLEVYHVRHRVYDPLAGRFLQRDPIGYAGGLNLYMYAGNEPYRFVDPMGLFFGEGAVFGPFYPTYLLTTSLINAVQNGQAAADTIAQARGDAGPEAHEVVAAVLGELTGVNNAVAGTVGYDARTNTVQTSEERWSKGLQGYAQMVLLALAPVSGGEVSVVDDGAGRTAASDGVVGIAKRSTPESGTALARRLGAEGEEAAGIEGPKTGYEMPSGKTRFPDEVTRNVVKEVKNVEYLSLTEQLRDYLGFAKQTGKKFELWTRPDTKLSGPLEKLIESKQIHHCTLGQ